MKPVNTTVWDPAEYLETEEQIIAYLDDIFKSGDPDLIVMITAMNHRLLPMGKRGNRHYMPILIRPSRGLVPGYTML
ncbi:MAG: hypothetical protein LBO80_01020 [Treponema sp.]|jgi:hypothetical protein|nr:hypothetical protein [Treponema sp.]